MICDEFTGKAAPAAIASLDLHISVDLLSKSDISEGELVVGRRYLDELPPHEVVLRVVVLEHRVELVSDL